MNVVYFCFAATRAHVGLLWDKESDMEFCTSVQAFIMEYLSTIVEGFVEFITLQF